MKNFITVLASFAVALAFANTAFASAEDYTNRYTFDEGRGWTAGDSVGNQNGSLTGTSTKFGWASGMIGTALEMDGVTGESVILPDGLAKGSRGSVSMWFKLKDLTDRNILFSGRSSSDTYIYSALMVNYEGRPQFLFRQTTDGADQKAQGAKMLNTNEWYQLVFTADSQTYRMYVNGEEVSVTGNSIGKWFPELTNRTLMYRIGALESYPLSGTFNGFIDDVRVYDHVLSLGDVTALYNGGKPGTPGVPPAVVPITTIVLTTTPTTTPAVSTPVVATTTPPVPAPAPVAPPVVTPVTQTPPAVSAEATRKAQIQELIKQILLLIAELQKQLAALKAKGA